MSSVNTVDSNIVPSLADKPKIIAGWVEAKTLLTADSCLGFHRHAYVFMNNFTTSPAASKLHLGIEQVPSQRHSSSVTD